MTGRQATDELLAPRGGQLELWYTRCPVPTAFSVALANGFVDDALAGEGVVLRSLAEGDAVARQSHFTQGQAHLVRHGGNVPPLIARSRGADVRLVGLSWPTFYEPLLVLPAAGIDAVADLRGRRVSAPRRVGEPVDFWRATSRHGVERALATAGLSLAEVELVDIPVDRRYFARPSRRTDARAPLSGALELIGHQREEGMALLTGEVDAVFSHASLAPALQGFTGAIPLVDVGALPGRRQRVNNGVPQALTVTGDLLDARPDVVARVLAATLRAADWAAEHAAEARRIVAAEVGLPEELVGMAYSDDVASELDVSLDGERLDGLRRQAAWLHDQGFLDGPLDVDAFVDPRPLAAARELLVRGEVA